MADTLAPVILVSPDTVDTPNGRVFAVGEGLKKTDNGPGSTFLVEPSGRLTSLATMGVNGMVSYNDTAKAYLPRTILGGSGINVENGDGALGNPSITLQPESTVQLIRVANGSGAVQTTIPQINFKAGTGISIAINSVGSGTAAEIVINSNGIVPGGGTVTSVGATSTDSTITITGTPNPIVDSGSFNFSVNTIGISKGGLGTTALAAGSLVYGPTTGNVASTLAIGPANSLLGSTGTAPAWVATTTPTTGQIVTFDGTNIVWSTPASGGVTSVAVTSNNAFVTVGGSPITTSGTISLSIGTLALANAGLGAAYATSTVGSVAGYLANDTRIRPISAGATNPNALLKCDTNANPGWTAGASLPGQVMVIGPASTGATWSTQPASNGQVFTYVNSGTGAAWVTPTGGSGTVTSVDASGDGIVTTSGGPITTSGTLAMAFSTTGFWSSLVANQYAGITPLAQGNSGFTIASNKVTANSIILVTTGPTTGNLIAADIGNNISVSSKNPGNNFGVGLANPVGQTNVACYWLIIN